MKKIILFAVGILSSVAMLAENYVKEGETTRGYLIYEYGIVTYDDNSVKNVATLISGEDFSGTKPEIKSSTSSVAPKSFSLSFSSDPLIVLQYRKARIKSGHSYPKHSSPLLIY